MSRHTRVPETILQQAMALFYPTSLPEALEALNAVNALLVERVKAEGYVPTNAAQDAPARPRAVPAKRGRPAAVKAPVTVAEGIPATEAPAPPATPSGNQGAPVDTPPVAPPETAAASGSLTMPTLGDPPPPDPPVVPAGGRAHTA